MSLTPFPVSSLTDPVAAALASTLATTGGPFTVIFGLSKTPTGVGGVPSGLATPTVTLTSAGRQVIVSSAISITPDANYGLLTVIGIRRADGTVIAREFMNESWTATSGVLRSFPAGSIRLTL